MSEARRKSLMNDLRRHSMVSSAGLASKAAVNVGKDIVHDLCVLCDTWNDHYADQELECNASKVDAFFWGAMYSYFAGMSWGIIEEHLKSSKHLGMFQTGGPENTDLDEAKWRSRLTKEDFEQGRKILSASKAYEQLKREQGIGGTPQMGGLNGNSPKTRSSNTPFSPQIATDKVSDVKALLQRIGGSAGGAPSASSASPSLGNASNGASSSARISQLSVAKQRLEFSPSSSSPATQIAKETPSSSSMTSTVSIGLSKPVGQSHIDLKKRVDVLDTPVVMPAVSLRQLEGVTSEENAFVAKTLMESYQKQMKQVVDSIREDTANTFRQMADQMAETQQQVNKLNTEILVKEKTNQQLRSELSTAMQMIRKHDLVISENARNSLEKAELRDVQSSLQALETTVDEMQYRNNHELANLKDETLQLRSDLGKADVDFETINTQLENLTSAQHEIKVMFGTDEQDRKTRVEDVYQLGKDVREVKGVVEELRRTFMNSSSARSTSGSVSLGMAHHNVDALSTEVKTAKIQREQLQRNVEAVQNQLSRLQQNHDNVMHDYTLSTKNVEQLGADLDALLKDHHSLKTEVVSVSAGLDSMNADLRMVKEQGSTWQVEFDRVSANVNKQRTQLDRLNAGYIEHETNQLTIKEGFDRVAKTVEMNHEDRVELRSEIAKIRQMQETMAPNLLTPDDRKASQRMAESIQMMTDRQNNVDQSLERLDEQRRHVSNELDKVNEQISNVSTTQQTDKLEWTNQLNTVKDQVDALSQLQVDMEQTSIQMTSTQESINDVDARMAVLRHDFALSKDQLQKVEKKTDRVLALEKNVQQLNQDVENMEVVQTGVRKLKDEMAVTKRESTEARNKVQDIVNKMSSTDASFSKMQTDLDRLRSLPPKMEALNQSWDSVKHRWETSLLDREKSDQMIQLDLKQIESRVQEVMGSVKSAAKDRSSIREEIDRFRSIREQFIELQSEFVAIITQNENNREEISAMVDNRLQTVNDEFEGIKNTVDNLREGTMSMQKDVAMMKSSVGRQERRGSTASVQSLESYGSKQVGRAFDEIKSLSERVFEVEGVIKHHDQVHQTMQMLNAAMDESISTLRTDVDEIIGVLNESPQASPVSNFLSGQSQPRRISETSNSSGGGLTPRLRMSASMRKDDVLMNRSESFS